MSHTPHEEEELVDKVRKGVSSLKVTPVATPSVSRRGSGVILTPSGGTVAFFTRTNEERDAAIPHA